MIHIIKVYKDIVVRKQFTFSLTETLEFIEKLADEDFKTGNFYIVMGEIKEIEQVFSYFNEDVFIPAQYEMFDVFLINPKTKMGERRKQGGAKHFVLDRVKEQIELLLDHDEELTLERCGTYFVITISNDEDITVIESGYDFKIINSCGKNSKKHIRLFNKVVRKKRYYYKKEGNKQ